MGGLVHSIDKTGTLRTRKKQRIAYADDVSIVTKQRKGIREILEIVMGLKNKYRKNKFNFAGKTWEV